MKTVVVLLAALISLSACGMFKMPEKMDDMKATTEDMKGMTKEALHKQTLLLAKNEMLKPENTENLSTPNGLVAGAEVFAKEATPLELAQIAYVWTTEINKAQPDRYQKVVGGDPSKPTEKAYTQAYKVKFDHDKLVKYTALQAVFGLAPQASIEAMIAEQITAGGRYKETTFGALMARARFLEAYMLRESVLSKPIVDIGVYHEAQERLANFDYLTKLPFADKIELKFDASTFFNEESVPQDKLDTGAAKELWQKLAEADKTLDVKYKADARFIAGKARVCTEVGCK